METKLFKKRSHTKRKEILRAKIRKEIYEQDINLHTDRLKHSTIPKIAKKVDTPKDVVCDYVKILRNNARTCLKNMHEDNFLGLPVLRGCYPNGVDEECANCCAIPTITKLRDLDGPNREIYRNITQKISGKLSFNGNMHVDLYPLTKIPCGKMCYNYMLVYSGEISKADLDTLCILLQLPFFYPMHNFIFVTKLPEILWDKMQPVIELLREDNMDITCLNNLHAVVSIGMNKYMHRLDSLRLFDGFQKHGWFKPLLEEIVDCDLSGIDSIRIASEKGRNARPCNFDWVLNLMKQARDQGVSAYYDPTSKERKKYGNRSMQGFNRVLNTFYKDI